MTLTINFEPNVEAWLHIQAQLQGVPPAEVVKQLVEEHIPTVSALGELTVFPPPGRAAARLRARLNAEATDDPLRIRAAQAELDVMKQHLNAERDRAGAERLF